MLLKKNYSKVLKIIRLKPFEKLLIFWYQLTAMLKVVPLKVKIIYLKFCIVHFKEIFLTERFLKADKKISNHLSKIRIKTDFGPIHIPFERLEQKMDEIGNDYASLELVRELFVNNEYLREFKKDLKADIVIDVGSNRGFFMLSAFRRFKSSKIISIEPQKNMLSIRELLTNANRIPFNNLIEYTKFCSSNDNDNAISINRIIEENKIENIDFLKMDVEGAEAEIFSKNVDWLSRCKNLSMEIHYSMADVAYIPDLLKAYGFSFVITSLRGKPFENNVGLKAMSRGCAYLYASREGKLKKQKIF